MTGKLRVAQAVAVMTAHGLVGSDASRAQRIQVAMIAAVIAAQAEGITDPETIRERQLAARDKILGDTE